MRLYLWAACYHHANRLRTVYGILHQALLNARWSFSRRSVVSDIEVMTADEVEHMSNEFVRGLDRSRLGKFAVPLDVLQSVDILYRLYVMREALSEDSPYWNHSRKTVDVCKAAGVDEFDAVAEMLLWWTVKGDPFRDFNKAKSLPVAHSDRMARLTFIAAHPDKNDYFVAGVWDVDFIERCISEGVDAELASTLLIPVGV